MGTLGKLLTPGSLSFTAERGSVSSPSFLSLSQVTLSLPGQGRSATACAECLSHASCHLFISPTKCLRHERPDWLRPGPVPQCGWPLGGQEHINSSCWGTWSQTRGETSLPPLLPRPEWGKRSCVQELGAPWARNALPLPACASLYPLSSDTCGPATQGRRSAVMGRGERLRRTAVENAWPFCPVIRRPFLLCSKVPVLPGHPRAAPCTCASAAAHPRSSAPRTVPEELRTRSSFRSCLASPPEARRPRKRVVFADTKGPSLTSVHRFEDAVGGDSEEDSCRGSSCARPEQPSSPEPRL